MDDSEFDGDRAMAVAIAEDVLERIRLQKLRLDVGSYLTLVEPHRRIPDRLRFPAGGKQKWDLAEVKDVVDDVEKVCEVCLLGACMLSKARLYDEMRLGKLAEVTMEKDGDDWRAKVVRLSAGRGTVTDQLAWAFSRTQMSMMEAAFEVDVHFVMDRVGSMPVALASASFAMGELEASERVKKVMENVVANNGVFLPGELPAEALTESGRDELLRKIRAVRKEIERIQFGRFNERSEAAAAAD